MHKTAAEPPSCFPKALEPSLIDTAADGSAVQSQPPPSRSVAACLAVYERAVSIKQFVSRLLAAAQVVGEDRLPHGGAKAGGGLRSADDVLEDVEKRAADLEEQRDEVFRLGTGGRRDPLNA